jgi:hypothetical protein
VSAARGVAIVAGIVTLALARRLAAGVGLSWGASNVVGVAQSLILRRLVRRAGAV